MTPTELESAGWKPTRPRAKPPYLSVERNGYEIRVIAMRPGGRLAADLYADPFAEPVPASLDFDRIQGKAQWTKHGDATERALASLGACMMADGRTVREWALSPVVTP